MAVDCAGCIRPINVHLSLDQSPYTYVIDPFVLGDYLLWAMLNNKFHGADTKEGGILEIWKSQVWKRQ